MKMVCRRILYVCIYAHMLYVFVCELCTRAS